MSTIKTMGPKPLIKLVAVCRGCRQRHEIPPVEPGTPFLAAMDTWANKHQKPGCEIEFISAERTVPRDLDDKIWMQMGEAPWWLEHKEFSKNDDILLAWASTAAMTFSSLVSLASDTNLLAGASALAIDNSSNVYLDYMLSGWIANGTAPTAGKVIQLYLYRAYQSQTPTYPDVLDGTDSTKTVTTTNVLYTLGRLAACMAVANTANQKNYFDVGAISAYWNGVTPNLWSAFVVQNIAQALNATGTNHKVYYEGSHLKTV